MCATIVGMPGREELSILWPQFGLQIRVEGARLETPTDEQLDVLARLAGRTDEILDDDKTHFVMWMEGRTPGEIEQQRTARVQSNRDLTRRPGWTLDLAVVVDGEPVGIQCISGFDQWPRRRIVGTTSWLIKRVQGRGLGTRCRAAVLELAFQHLGADVAKSWVLQDNHASIGVSTKLGYRIVSEGPIVENDRELTEVVYQLDAADWLDSPTRRRYAPVIEGADPVIELLSR
jgi:RimJ/RimL family protein N-acetyltransferase